MLPKILIIRFSSIGDIVLTTPVIRALKQQFNNGNNLVHYVTKKPFAGIITANPYVDKVYGIEKSTSEIIEQLQNEDYDYIVDLHKNIRSYRIKRKLKRLSFTFDKINFEKWLAVNLKMVNRLPDKHIVDRYFEAIAPLGVENDNKGLDYFIPEGENFQPSKISEKLNKQFIVFAIGGTYATKRLPDDKIIEICRKINKHILLIGGKEEASSGQKIASLSGSHVFNACGKLSVHKSADAIRQSLKVITHDTGMMHIAAAFNKPMASIWGNTIPEFGMYPYMPANPDRYKIFEVKGLKCRPCSKLGYRQCPKKHFYCMNLQETDLIADWANS